MRTCPRMTLIALLAAALLAGCQCDPVRPPAAGAGAADTSVDSQQLQRPDEVSFEFNPEVLQKPHGDSPPRRLRDPLPESVARAAEERNRALFEESLEVREYFARPGTCGQALAISPVESGPFKEVYRTGPEDPKDRLRWHAYYFGRFIIRGRFTGKTESISYCGYYPEFEILSFKPWGPVRRCTSIGALDGDKQLYTEHLPKDRYAPEDFVDGPELLQLDDSTCRRTARCKRGELLVEDCSSKEPGKLMWCCRPLPLTGPGEDGGAAGGGG